MDPKGSDSVNAEQFPVLNASTSRVSVFMRLTPQTDARLTFTEGEKARFADVVGSSASTKLAFFPPGSKAKTLVSIPVELAKQTAKTYHSTLFGYFLGPRVPFLVVQQAVKRNWGKFGFQDMMMNANGVYFLKFNDEGGCAQVIEQGPLFIRGAPFFVDKWDPAKGLTKPVHSSCPLWIKLHNIPLVAFNVEGIGRIASAIGIPKQMDSATASMCDKAWGRPGFAKVLVDTWAVGDLKREIEVVVPSLTDAPDAKVMVCVEYLWEPMQCSHCLVFGHKKSGCAKAVVVESKKQKQQEVDSDGFTTVTRKQWRPKVATNVEASTSGIRSTPEPGSTSVNDTIDDGSKQDSALGADMSPLVEIVDDDRNVESEGTKPQEKSLDDAGVSNIGTPKDADTRDKTVLQKPQEKDSGLELNVPPLITTVAEAMLPKQPLKSILKNPNRFSVLNPDDRGGGGAGVKIGNSSSSNTSQRARGLSGNLDSVRDLIAANGVSVCAIVESKVSQENLGSICDSVFRSWSWVSNIACCDAGARVILAWDMCSLDIVLIESHAQYLHCLVRIKGIDDSFFATFVYGSNSTTGRRELWSGLRKAKVLMNQGSWVVLGDFNAMLFQHDGYGGSSRRNVDMEDFYLCMEDVELFDVSYVGIQYTWCQKPIGGDGILRKLDRILCNVDFTSLFRDAHVRFLPRGVSDHSPGLLSFGGDIRKVVAGFRFDNFVVQHPNFNQLVAEAWHLPTVGSFMYKLMCKLKALKKPMRQLRARYGDISKRVVFLKTELDIIQTSLDSDPGNKMLQEDLAHLYLAYQQAKLDEESYYRQRAKVQWLKEGDMNTKYFHKCVKEKHGHSFIHSIIDQHGNFVMGDGVGSTFLHHFENILGTRDTSVSANIPTELFDSSLSLSESLDIIRPIGDDEIKNAIFGIGNDKAPGSDGFTSKFFKSSWDVVGEDVTIAVHNFFYSGRLLKEVNHTLICLIPKCPNASRVGDYRPISCCSVIYKCISKIISDRIKPYLNNLVSKSQSAFIPGRRISDNILLAHELVSSYHKSSGPPKCAFKIDIRKAYDTVDWMYVINMLTGFGFHPVLIAWIKEMLNTSSFSLAINGESVGFFKGARGLRQGDPISPYLFTIVMKGFNMALKHCIQQANTLFGFHDGCHPLGISHLCFADDLFVFTRGDIASVDVLKRALELFRGWSGMVPSLEKSEVFFSNVPEDTKSAILGLLPFSAGTFPIRYLGVPLSPSLLRVTDYQGLVEKVTKRIHNWKVKTLSFVGRKLLISSVLQSLQLYWMSVFLLPSGIVHELESLFRKFLWAQGDSVQGRCKLSWDVVCKPLEEGGLGIRRLGIWNRAIITKHLWDILNSRPTIWVQWVYLHYLQGKSIWSITAKSSWSWVFRKLLDLRPLVRRFFFHRIGNGHTTNAWVDTWLECGSLSDIIPYRRFSRMGFTTTTTARELILTCDSAWPADWYQIFPNLHLYDIPTILDANRDEVCWKRLDGTLTSFSVGVAYSDLNGHSHTVGWAKEVWFKGCIPKHAFCVWTACHGRLPTQDRLYWKHDPPDLSCPLCNALMDSHDHLFFLCDFSLEVWRTIKKDTSLFGFAERWEDICNDLRHGHGPRKKEQRLALQAAVYCVWRERNRRLFGNRRNTVSTIVKEIRDVVLNRMAWMTFDGTTTIG
ncbi:hypothetical protein OSB04_009848 [Centaurea solstitialis]|uniref:Reverse transcriptase domain-containing protein n=1 Tax=Centaurea solstitialis TaxID=347529 RepID=A0AA38T829_9ASTR|nr:hypothetical protein OSB04_009848 [Centaurea solstitialis]